METLFQDIRFGVRILLRSPGMTILVIAALALGIGANSAMFSIVDALLLRPVRYREPDTLTLLWDRDAQGVIRYASAANFLDWRTRTKSFTDLAGWSPASFVMGGEQPEQIGGAAVTSNFFRTLGVAPALGRSFLPEEDGIGNANAAPVAVISYRLWQDRLGGSSAALGQTIQLNSKAYTVIGVLPPDFQFLTRRTYVYVPISINPQDREYHYLTVVGRLGVARAQAITEMSALASQLGEAYPSSNKGWTIQVDDFEEWLVNRSFRTRLLLLSGAVGLVLLIACTNVASLLLARSAGRAREMAVRISVGATRLRLARQLLTESILLSMAGGALGLGLAWLLIRAAPKFVPPNAIPAAGPIELNPLVLWFTLAVSAATGILFGIAPAISATRTGVHGTLKDSSRGSTAGRGRQSFRQAMVMTEVALALVLLAGASLMIESLRKMNQIELGFDPNNVLTLRLFLPAARYDAAHALQFHQKALEKLAALPGVESVAAASNVPLLKISMAVPFDLESGPERGQGERPGVGYTTITPGYLHTLGIPLRRGRMFADTDNEKSPPVVIVNDAFARRYFPNQNPVGQRILLNRPLLGQNNFADTIQPEIVGQVGNVKLELLPEPEPLIYAPHAQNIWSAVTWFAVRSSLNPAALAGPIRRTMMELDSQQPIDQVSSLDQLHSNQFAEPRFQTDVMGAFAGLALLLAAVGIYGVTSNSVVQQRHEIGVRMALGASPGMVMRDVMGRGLSLIGIGLVIGLIGSVAIASTLASVLVGVSPTDPATLGLVSAGLACVAAIACFFPALRATRVDPAIALRED